MSATPLQKEYPRHNPAEESLEEAKSVEMPAVDPEFTARMQEGPAEEGGRVNEIQGPGKIEDLTEAQMIKIEQAYSSWLSGKVGEEGNVFVDRSDLEREDPELAADYTRVRAQRKRETDAEVERKRPEQEAAQRAREEEIAQQKAAQAQWSRENKAKTPDVPPAPTGIDHARILNGPDATQALDLDKTGKPRKQSAWSKVKGLFGG